jgi:hypothetical protein
MRCLRAYAIDFRAQLCDLQLQQVHIATPGGRPIEQSGDTHALACHLREQRIDPRIRGRILRRGARIGKTGRARPLEHSQGIHFVGTRRTQYAIGVRGRLPHV